jgi:hypothetical protein
LSRGDISDWSAVEKWQFASARPLGDIANILISVWRNFVM